MLTSNDQKCYRAYVKKLENGFGIKTINTTNGVENVFMITSDSVFQSNEQSTIKSPMLKPILSTFSQENVCTESIGSFTESNLAINRILTHLEPYLKKLRLLEPNIAGFHVFEKENSSSAPNIQKTSIIVVANTKLAREKGVHINIPGKLMKVHGVDNDNIPFEADSVVKPLTIMVGDYKLHINICFELALSCNKTAGTQTQKEFLLTSSADDDDDASMVYNIESLFYVQSQTEHKEIQTDDRIKISKEIQTEGSSQTVSTRFAKDCTTQTESVMMCYPQELAPDIGTVSDNATIEFDRMPSVTRSTEHIEASKSTTATGSDHLIKNNTSCSSLNTFNSHTKLCLDTFDSHTKLKNCKSSLDTFVRDDQIQNSSSSYISESSTHELSTSSIDTIIIEDDVIRKTNKAGSPETNTTIIFENFSECKTKATISGDLAMDTGSSRYDTLHQSNSIKLGCSYRNKESIRIGVGDNAKEMDKTKSNVSIKEIKEHLNKTTLSLYQLYSVVELIEDLSIKSSNVNVLLTPKENTVRNMCKEKTTPIQYTGTLVNTLEATNILENEPSDNLCDNCGLLFPKSKHHECINEQQTTDDKSVKQTDLDYKFVDVLQKDNLECQHICLGNGSNYSEIELSDSNKSNRTSFSSTKLKEVEIDLKDSRIFYNNKYKTMHKSKLVTNFLSNSTLGSNKSTIQFCKTNSNIRLFDTVDNAYTVKKPNAYKKPQFFEKTHKTIQSLQCHKYFNKNNKIKYRNGDINEHNKEELLVVIPLTKDNDTIQIEDTAVVSKNQKFTIDKSMSLNNLVFENLKDKTIHQEKSKSSTIKHVKSRFNLMINYLAKTKSTTSLDSNIEYSEQHVNQISNVILKDLQNTLVEPRFHEGNNQRSTSVIKLFQNDSQFSSKINSSCNTLHIIPSSEEHLQVNCLVPQTNLSVCSKMHNSKELKETITKSKTLSNESINKIDLLKSEIDIVGTIPSNKHFTNSKDQIEPKDRNNNMSAKNFMKEKNKKTKKRIFCFVL
uniref:Uncharacterized protein n=1 Tax=Graphocephala atropunctata TaxID=36148 RepID=A0A1B6MJN9_9HEMI